MAPAGKPVKAAKPVEVVSFENELQTALGTKVEIKCGKNVKKARWLFIIILWMNWM